MNDDTQHNKELAIRYLNGIFSLNAEEAATLMHEKFEWIFPNITMRHKQFDKTSSLDFIDKILSVLPNGIECDIQEITAEASRVAVAIEGRAKTIDGDDYNNRYHLLLYIKDKKIIRHIEYLDSYLAAKVLGPKLKSTS